MQQRKFVKLDGVETAILPIKRAVVVFRNSIRFELCKYEK